MRWRTLTQRDAPSGSPCICSRFIVPILLSPARGTADVEQFGINENYTNTMVTNDMSCPIEETTRLWIGVPAYDLNENVLPHNYVVIKKAPSINSITYAIKEVSVT